VARLQWQEMQESPFVGAAPSVLLDLAVQTVCHSGSRNAALLVGCLLL